MRYCNLIRDSPHYRREAFEAGLKTLGEPASHEQCDLLVIWNRYGGWDVDASQVEKRGGTVLVVENGYLGNEFAGGRWYAISRGQHNGAGTWPEGGPERWDALGVELAPWREGREIVVLPQRGIGRFDVAMPMNWTSDTVTKLGKLTKRPVRVREHPGVNPCIPLAEDLADAHAVVTWGSGAALKALALGVPVYHDFPRWIGAGASLRLGMPMDAPLRSTEARLAMFRRLAWAMWPLEQITSGEAFRCILARPS